MDDIIKEFLTKIDGNSFASVVLFTLILKKYVINGSIEKFFSLKNRELDLMARILKEVKGYRTNILEEN